MTTRNQPGEVIAQPGEVMAQSREVMATPKPLAWACDQPVTDEDVQALLSERVPPAALGTAAELMMRWALGVLIVEAVVTSHARARGCDGTGTLKKLVGEEELAARPVSQIEVKEYYERNLHLYQRPAARRVSHVRARSACTLSSLTTRPSAVSDLGWVTRGELAGPLEDAIFGADVGDWVGPVEVASSWHAVRVERARPADVACLDEVAGEIHAVLARARSAAAWASWLESHLECDVVMAPGSVRPFGPGAYGWAHRH